MPRLSIDGLWPFLLLILAAYLLLLALLYFSQSKMLFQPNLPSRELTATPADMGLPFDSVRFSTADGIKLHGWFVAAPESKLTLLFFHGNAGNISHRLHSLLQFHQLGLSTFIFDYRGYGESEGSPGEQESYHDAAAAWRYLTEELNLSGSAVLLFGRSLGGAVATWLAAREQPAGLIVESTFTSIPDLAADLYPWLPARQLARIHYPTLERIAEISAPLLVVHSEHDELIPFDHGRQLFDRAKEPKQLLPIAGGHNDGPFTTGPRYTEGLRSFINTLNTRKH